jgi:hypothetical protein
MSTKVVLIVLLTVVCAAVIIMGALVVVQSARRCHHHKDLKSFVHTNLPNIDDKLWSPVIHLTWNDDTKTYDIQLVIGTNKVSAAFDTGSAQLVVRTSDCKSCTGSSYVPTDSTSSRAILNTNTGGNKKTLCRTSIAYVSQTDTLQIYSDTVSFPRVLATNCTADLSTLSRTSPLVVKEFPIGGIIANTGHSSVNVFGMSGVMSTNQATPGQADKYLMPSCQETSEATYESPVLQAISTNTTVPLVWSIRFAAHRADGALVSFGTTQRCGSVAPDLKVTKCVRSLPDAPSALVGTPWRYYVIHVRSATTAVNTYPLQDFPEYLLVDTATTQFMVPGNTSVDILTQYGLILTLENEEGSTLTWAGSQEAQGVELEDYDPSDTALFTHMSDQIASEFSLSGSVGILGALAMRGRYMEFAFGSIRTIAFG